MSTKPRSCGNQCTVIASVMLALVLAAAFCFGRLFGLPQPPLVKAVVIPTAKTFDTDAYICALHHRIQASNLSSDVRTFYEFVGAENPRMQSFSHISASGLSLGFDAGHDAAPVQQRACLWDDGEEEVEREVLFLTVLDFLMARPDVRAHYNYMFLRPLTQPSDRVAMLRTLCGRD
ncbi:hypothetical protein GQ607_015752 [Colletotrichum asianum]|uniref:Uncharacterized protein n=1 Tax=Colletotrichum asianum TaxID=702518 RepID=A0A8H3W002_9PEZI|nr:hypothetical protein GQ607_015752 [Colletotrichum asianum]